MYFVLCFAIIFFILKKKKQRKKTKIIIKIKKYNKKCTTSEADRAVAAGSHCVSVETSWKDKIAGFDRLMMVWVCHLLVFLRAPNFNIFLVFISRCICLLCINERVGLCFESLFSFNSKDIG